jgi:hypothetical protein
MTYRTKRPRTRAILTFGVGVTLAITQLGAGCVPADRSRRCMTSDASDDDSGECVSTSGPSADGATDGGGDAK